LLSYLSIKRKKNKYLISATALSEIQFRIITAPGEIRFAIDATQTTKEARSDDIPAMAINFSL